MLKGNSVISKNNGTSLWNFVLNSGLGKFRQDISIVETCYQLSSRKVDAESVINYAVVGPLSRYNTSELRRSTTIVCRTDYQALSTARFCCTGQLARADTWFRTCRTSSFCTVAWHSRGTSAIAERLVAHTCGNRGEPENQLIGQFRLSAERIMHDDICVWDC